MKQFKIPVVYTVYGYVDVEAENIEEAIDMANDPDCPLPDEADYVKGTWEVDVVAAYEVND